MISLFECEFDLLIGLSSRPYVTCMSYLLVRVLVSSFHPRLASIDDFYKFSLFFWSKVGAILGHGFILC